MGRSLALLTPLAAGAAAALGAAALCLYRRATRKRTIVITGGCGNLGSKLAAHLAATRGEQVSLVLIEHPSYLMPELVPRGAALVALDLGDAVCAAALADTLRGADALVHFSAVNPYPNATWDESAQSMDHCFRALLGAAAAGARRVIPFPLPPPPPPPAVCFLRSRPTRGLLFVTVTRRCACTTRVLSPSERRVAARTTRGPDEGLVGGEHSQWGKHWGRERGEGRS